MVVIPRTSAITIRLEYDLIHEIEHWSEILRLKPSTLLSMIIKDKYKDFIKEYAETVYEEVNKLK